MAQKTKVKAKKAKPNHGDPTRFVVYTSQVGRTPAGIVRAYVSVVGRDAFVRKREDAVQADVLPAANVFDTRESAEAYLAGDGVRRWVVGTVPKHGTDIPVMLEAKVVFYPYVGRYQTESRAAVKRLSDGKAVEFYSRRDLSFFETKKGAEAAYAKLWRGRHEHAVKGLEEHEARVAAYEKCRPRTRKAA
jgi:hypothetical protein